jgi:Ca2+-dependent lipid-binding protein
MPPLFVHVSHAEGLAALDKSGTLDAYCVLSVDGFPIVERTQVVYRNCNPSWDEYFVLQQDFVGTEVLKISLFDRDTLSRDDPAGIIIVELSRVLKGTEGANSGSKGITGWFPVKQVMM